MPEEPQILPGDDGNIFGPPPSGGMSLDDVSIEESDRSRPITAGADTKEIREYHLWLSSNAIGNDLAEYYCRSKLANFAPANVDGGLVPKLLEIEPQRGGIYKGTVEYGLIDATSEFEFDTTGGQATVRQSYGTRKYGTGPTFGGLINCRDGRVEGVEITTPAMTWSETYSFAAITPAYRNFLFRMTGKVNSEPFRGTAAGECLFMGARGRKRGREYWQVQFNFAGSENVTDLQIAGGAIVVARKDGWEYLWVYDEPKVDSERVIPFPSAAYVEQVYRLADLSALGIGS